MHYQKANGAINRLRDAAAARQPAHHPSITMWLQMQEPDALIAQPIQACNTTVTKLVVLAQDRRSTARTAVRQGVPVAHRDRPSGPALENIVRAPAHCPQHIADNNHPIPLAAAKHSMTALRQPKWRTYVEHKPLFHVVSSG